MWRSRWDKQRCDCKAVNATGLGDSAVGPNRTTSVNAALSLLGDREAVLQRELVDIEGTLACIDCVLSSVVP